MVSGRSLLSENLDLLCQVFGLYCESINTCISQLRPLGALAPAILGKITPVGVG